jgi:hypothetical protein
MEFLPGVGAEQRVVDCPPVIASHGNNLHIRRSVAFQSDVPATQRRSRENYPIKVDNSEKTEITRLEGFDVRGVRLGHVAGGIDLTIVWRCRRPSYQGGG